MTADHPQSCCPGIRAAHSAAPRKASPAPVTGQRHPDRLIRIEGGEFSIGTDEKILSGDGEYPSRRVRVAPFLIDPYAVTNRDFAEFIDASGYVTEATRLDWSYVFAGLLPNVDATTAGAEGASWWRRVDGADWAHPEGPGSSVEARLDHPVIHVSWNDAQAYAEWHGARLPSEAEWECAAAGGHSGVRFPWGDAEPDDESNFLCNIWQGQFPNRDTGADGFRGTAPVNAFAPNGFGIYNMAGNVWEWCGDRFRIRSMTREAKARNAASLANNGRVLKGGSYLCHRSYCYRYRIAARIGNPPDTATGHVGFRLAYDLSR